MNIKIKNCRYLSEFISELPSNCLINKGITGCGGTTVELKSKRNSIILCPSKNLVTSKSENSPYLGVDGNVNKTQIRNYLMKTSSYKKIIATYNALPKLMEVIPNYSEYFLLVDEYHLLFNDYSFRGEPIKFILNNFHKFKNFCFMTATPLKEGFILKELENIPQINYEWENTIPVKMHIKDTYFVQKTLLELINTLQDKDIHIFLNSVSTIYSITKKLSTDDYRVVCSENSKTKIKNFSKITSPIKHINFYTSCAFEGCDIYSPNGVCIIVSDTQLATTVLDISTKVRQVCGRLRDSKYKDECYLILNTSKHRYAGTTKEEFEKFVKKSEILGKSKEELFNNSTELQKEAELRTYNSETYSSIYLNEYDNRIFFDENLKKMDIYNYNLISEIYNSSISILGELNKNNFEPTVIEEKQSKGLDWIISKLKELNKVEYTFDELTEIFSPLFKTQGLIWNKNTSIKKYFPEHKKVRKMIKGKQDTYYIFM